MSGAWEVVIGTLSGFVIAFFAEPVKRFFERKQLRNMLYREFIDNHFVLKDRPPNPSSRELIDIILLRLQTDSYDYAKVHNISLYYELKEASCFNQMYSICKQLKNIDKNASKESIEKLMEIFFKLTVHNAETGVLDEKLIEKLTKTSPSRTIYKWIGN
jgi:hypothetical protein